MKSIVVYSGGLDSTVLLYYLRNLGYNLKAITVDYGQRHRKEVVVAGRVTEFLGIEHRVVDLRSLQPLFSKSALVNVSEAVPDGHYEDSSMRVTVVPNRNMILLAVAAAWAINEQFDSVAYGAHSGDHAIYPDCREEFVEAMAQAIALADWHKVRILRPFLSHSKADICRLGAELRVPFGDTWSCYKGGLHHCGTCGTCTERREAFDFAGISDPTVYESLPSGHFGE